MSDRQGRNIAWLLSGFLLLVSQVALAQESQFLAHFAKGNTAYEARSYAAAEASYDSALATGQESGVLYFNKGNALFKQGKLAPAILNYLRAERLLPGDADVAANLALAKSMTRIQLVGDSLTTFDRTLEQTVGKFHLGTLTWLTTILFVLLAAVLTLRVGLQLPYLFLRPMTSLLFGLFLLGVTVTTARHYLDYGRKRGVIMAEGKVLTGPTSGADVELSVSPGLVARVLDESGDYLQVRFENLRQGWIERRLLELI